MKTKNFLVLAVCVCCLGWLFAEEPMQNLIRTGFKAEIEKLDAGVEDIGFFREMGLNELTSRVHYLTAIIGIQSTSFGEASTPGLELCVLWHDLACIYTLLGPDCLKVQYPSVKPDFPVAQGESIAHLQSLAQDPMTVAQQLEERTKELETVIGIQK